MHVKKETTARSKRKLEQILAAARRLFLEHGYADTSMDAVAAESGVSKATLYVYYQTKKELFAAIVDDFLLRYAAADIEHETPTSDIRRTLRHIAVAILKLMLAPDTIAAYRMVIAEATRHPELGELYYNNGPGHLLPRIASLLARAMKAGQLRKASPEVAAEHFILLVRGSLQMRALVLVREQVTDKQRMAIINSGVDAFYRAYRPDRARTGPRREADEERGSA